MQIVDIHSVFSDSCHECSSCIYAVCKPEYSLDPQKLMIRGFVITYAFLKFYTGWEHFLEQSFIAYSLGEKSQNGNKPTRFIFPTDEDHAERIIRGFAMYPDWTKTEDVLTLACNLFENGEPFNSELRNIASSLKEAKTIRNTIGHNSQKSREAFKSLVRNKYSASMVGISVSDFLIAQKNPRAKPYFEEYFLLMQNAANNIINY